VNYVFFLMVAILSQGISDSSMRGEGRNLNVLGCCRPIIWHIEASSM
jgi:hypothetical protein